ncbi:MAG: hypothetical protein ACOVOT_09100 [Rubrivivax sp.]|nr:hypothetical protein [Rubrivivax sp.]
MAARKDERHSPTETLVVKLPCVRTLDGLGCDVMPAVDSKQFWKPMTSRWATSGDRALMPGPRGLNKAPLEMTPGRKAVVRVPSRPFGPGTSPAAQLTRKPAEELLEDKPPARNEALRCYNFRC